MGHFRFEPQMSHKERTQNQDALLKITKIKARSCDIATLQPDCHTAASTARERHLFRFHFLMNTLSECLSMTWPGIPMTNELRLASPLN
uniref:Uncharacterized protein n=1 Tax=Steinernema glaseri TaxID=37863 RepID=A0A1I8A525_9BILA